MMHKLLLILSVAAQLTVAGSSVTFNTEPLVTLSSPPSLVLTLINGDATSDNTVSVSALTLGGGSPIGNANLTTGASGALPGGITLIDKVFQVEFSQQWTPGTALAFFLDFTTNFSGGSPDSFSLSVLDPSTGQPIPTLDPFGTDTFLSVDLRNGATIQTFRSDLNRTTIDLQAPVITPEPSTIVVVGLGLSVLLYRRLLHNSDAAN